MFHYCKGTKPPFLLPWPPEAHLPSLPSASSRTTGGATSEGFNSPAIFQRSHDWRACAWDDDWLKKKKNHASGDGLCRAHASSACLCVSWPGWGEMGFQLPGGHSPETPSNSWPARVHHEACNSRLEKRRAKLGSWSLASECCVHAWKLQAGLAISLSRILVLCRLCKSGTNVHTLCGGTHALSPFSFTNPHLTAYETLGISISRVSRMSRGR